MSYSLIIMNKVEKKYKLLRGKGGRITGAGDNKMIMPGCISVPNQDRCILLHNYK